MRPRFANKYSVPPGGKFFCEIGGRMYEGRNFDEICGKVRPALAALGSKASAEDVIAEYMCPRLGPSGSWFCRGDFRDSDAVREREAMENSERYFGTKVVPFDVIQRRLERCLACPMHYRGWCLTCNGHLDRMVAGFDGARPRLPIDVGTGICKCARAYESVICSVEHDDKVWEGVPETCWRLKDV